MSTTAIASAAQESESSQVSIRLFNTTPSYPPYNTLPALSIRQFNRAGVKMASTARENIVNIRGMCRRAGRTMVVLQGRRRMEVNDAVHVAWLSGLKHQLKHASDEVGTHVTVVCEWELRARLGLDRPGPPVAP